MRKNLLFVFFALISLSLFTGCQNDNEPSYENHAMNQKTTVGFYSGDAWNATFTYQPYQIQKAYGENAEGYLYRLSHATDLQTFQLSGLPKSVTPNQEFEANLTIQGFSGKNFDGKVKCAVTKVDGGKVWILDTDHNYGFIIEYK